MKQKKKKQVIKKKKKKKTKYNLVDVVKSLIGKQLW